MFRCRGNRLHHGMESRLSVRREGTTLGRVPREVKKQWGVVVGDVAGRAEARVCVETSGAVLWVEDRREEEHLPHRRT